MENLKLLSETLLDNYRITIDMKKECTRVLLGLASPLLASNRFVLLVSVRLQEWFGIQDRKQLPGGVKCLLLAVSSDRK